MSIPRPTITELPVAEITVQNDRLRVVSEAKVAALMALISDIGFMGRIRVRRAGKINTLIDGAHRLEAVKRLGLKSIPTDVVECSLDEARQQEVATNLVAGMTPLQDAIFLAEWQAQQEKLHPELKRGVAGAMAKHGMQGSLRTVADAVAEARQINPRQVRKIIQAARNLTIDERAKLQSADCTLMLKDIIEIGRISDVDVRYAVIRKLSLGAAKSVSQARHAHAVEMGAVPEADVQGDNERAFKALFGAWKRAPMAVKRRFALEISEEFDAATTDPDEVM